MSRKIKLSRRSLHKLEKLLEYLEKEWSAKVKEDFIEKFDKAVKIIQNNPLTFQKSEIVKGLHMCIISKQTTLYYRFDDKRVYIVTLFDNRQNPKRMKEETKE